MRQKRCINCMKEIPSDGRYCRHCGYDQQTEQMSNGLRPNTILRRRYFVGRVIGKGGFGITYAGFDLTLEMKVAIKEYYPSGIASRNNTWSNQVVWESGTGDQDARAQRADSMDRVLKEARRTARLADVPSIVRVTDAFCENETAYLVMDFIEGITLKEYLAQHGVLTWEECKQLLFPVMEGLSEAHDMGIIHRDISPDNIMIEPYGMAKLLDLGAAVDVNVNEGLASTLVVKNHFSAMEQYDENGKIGSWTDVYAFAAMFYYCLTGKLIVPVMDRLMTQGELSFPPQPEIPEHVKNTLRKALEIRQEDRIQDMREFERELAQGDEGSAVVAQRAADGGTSDNGQSSAKQTVAEVENAKDAGVGNIEDAGAENAGDGGSGTELPSRKRKRIIGIAAAACLLLVAGIAVFTYLNHTPSEITTTKKTGEITTAQSTTTQVNASISLNKSRVSAYIGDTAQLTATVSPSGSSVTWTSGDTSIVTVDSSGNLNALKNGTVTVQASISYGGSTYKASCEVTVKSPSVSLEESSVSIYAGDTAQLTAAVSPSSATVIYTTSNSSVVTVNSSGELTGVNNGTATVKATITYQGTQYQDSCSVTVSLTAAQTAARTAVEEGLAAEDQAEVAEKKAWEAAAAAEEAAEKAREAGTGKIQYSETYGVYTLSNGDKYEGHMSNYQWNGYGVYTFSDGGTYAGEWEDDGRSGYGVYTSASGWTYAGEWEDDGRSGYGVYDEETSSGNVYHYAGEWADDAGTGYGVFYYPSTNYYAGELKNLYRKGYGVLYSSDGVIKSEGLWVDDELQE